MLNRRLETFYDRIICEDFVVLYNFTNIAKLPKLEKVLLSSTSSNFGSSKISVLQSFCGWRLATSQKSVTTRARKSIALFNIRKDTLLGLKVTLRKKTMFSFLDKALIFILPKTITKISNNEEQQKNLLHFSQLKKNNTIFVRPGLFIDKFTNNKSKTIMLALPSFFKTRQIFYNTAELVTIFSDQFTKQPNKISLLHLPKKKYTTFLKKLYKNWEKQKNKNYSLFEGTHENQSKHGKPSSSFLSAICLQTKSAIDMNTKTNTDNKTKSVFTLSNNSALPFPEISSLSTFFDNFSGFSLTFSLKNSKFSQKFTTEREYLIKRQLFSAFGCTND